MPPYPQPPIHHHQTVNIIITFISSFKCRHNFKECQYLFRFIYESLATLQRKEERTYESSNTCSSLQLMCRDHPIPQSPHTHPHPTLSIIWLCQFKTSCHIQETFFKSYHSRQSVSKWHLFPYRHNIWIILLSHLLNFKWSFCDTIFISKKYIYV